MNKKIDWEKIKKRYLQGDKPGAIATDYGLTSKQVRDRASRHKWGAAKQGIGDEIATKIATEIKAEVAAEVKANLTNHFTQLDSIFGSVLANIKAELPNMGALKHDGENAANQYHMQAYKLGLRSYLKIKEAEAQSNPDGDRPGFNIIAPDA